MYFPIETKQFEYILVVFKQYRYTYCQYLSLVKSALVLRPIHTHRHNFNSRHICQFNSKTLSTSPNTL